jgi:hypothetical protein
MIEVHGIGKSVPFAKIGEGTLFVVGGGLHLRTGGHLGAHAARHLETGEYVTIWADEVVRRVTDVDVWLDSRPKQAPKKKAAAKRKATKAKE